MFFTFKIIIKELVFNWKLKRANKKRQKTIDMLTKQRNILLERNKRLEESRLKLEQVNFF